MKGAEHSKGRVGCLINWGKGVKRLSTALICHLRGLCELGEGLPGTPLKGKGAFSVGYPLNVEKPHLVPKTCHFH